MRRLSLKSFFCATLLILASLSNARADQLQAVPLDQARAMALDVSNSTFLVAYASMASDQHAEIWRVKRTVVAPMDQTGELGEEFAAFYETHVWGELLFRSKAKFTGELPAQIEWQSVEPAQNDLQAIDAAYVYSSDGENFASFRCVGKKLNFPCEVKTETVQLAPEIAEKLAQMGNETEE